jgi:hypothetical protein
MEAMDEECNLDGECDNGDSAHSLANDARTSRRYENQNRIFVPRGIAGMSLNYAGSSVRVNFRQCVRIIWTRYLLSISGQTDHPRWRDA